MIGIPSLRVGAPAGLVAALLLAGAAAPPLAAPLAGQTVRNTSYIAPSGDRVLRHQVVVKAPPGEVWEAFTTDEGLRSFVAPVASIDLRIGGIWEASYDPGAELGDPENIRNEIIAYLPEEMLAIRIARTPPDFPRPEVTEDLWTVIQLKKAGPGRTRVVTSMLGWGSGEAFDEVYDLFERGNAYIAMNLFRLFEEGPIDWSEARR